MLVRPAELISPDFLVLIQRRKALGVSPKMCKAVETRGICKSQLMRASQFTSSVLIGF